MKTPITKESLIAYGMKVNTGFEGHVFPMEKIISIREDDEKEGIGHMSILINRSNNSDQLCLWLPDGACIYLAIDNIEQLEAFEKCIASWEPNF